eukprot:PhF_6_TR16919/c0_g1_i2/m.25416
MDWEYHTENGTWETAKPSPTYSKEFNRNADRSGRVEYMDGTLYFIVDSFNMTYRRPATSEDDDWGYLEDGNSRGHFSAKSSAVLKDALANGVQHVTITEPPRYTDAGVITDTFICDLVTSTANWVQTIVKTQILIFPGSSAPTAGVESGRSAIPNRPSNLPTPFARPEVPKQTTTRPPQTKTVQEKPNPRPAIEWLVEGNDPNSWEPLEPSISERIIQMEKANLKKIRFDKGGNQLVLVDLENKVVNLGNQQGRRRIRRSNQEPDAGHAVTERHPEEWEYEVSPDKWVPLPPAAVAQAMKTPGSRYLLDGKSVVTINLAERIMHQGVKGIPLRPSPSSVLLWGLVGPGQMEEPLNDAAQQALQQDVMSVHATQMANGDIVIIDPQAKRAKNSTTGQVYELIRKPFKQAAPPAPPVFRVERPKQGGQISIPRPKSDLVWCSHPSGQPVSQKLACVLQSAYSEKKTKFLISAHLLDESRANDISMVPFALVDDKAIAVKGGYSFTLSSKK